MQIHPILGVCLLVFIIGYNIHFAISTIVKLFKKKLSPERLSFWDMDIVAQLKEVENYLFNDCNRDGETYSCSVNKAIKIIEGYRIDRRHNANN